MKHLKYVVLDWSWRDVKNRSIYTMPDVKDDFIKLFQNYFLIRCKKSKMKVGCFWCFWNVFFSLLIFFSKQYQRTKTAWKYLTMTLMLVRFDIHLSKCFTGESSVYFFFSACIVAKALEILAHMSQMFQVFTKKYDIELSATGGCNQRFSETFLTIVLHMVSFRFSPPA